MASSKYLKDLNDMDYAIEYATPIQWPPSEQTGTFFFYPNFLDDKKLGL